jgi:hypothetical protein
MSKNFLVVILLVILLCGCNSVNGTSYTYNVSCHLGDKLGVYALCQENHVYSDYHFMLAFYHVGLFKMFWERDDFLFAQAVVPGYKKFTIINNFRPFEDNDYVNFNITEDDPEPVPPEPVPPSPEPEPVPPEPVIENNSSIVNHENNNEEVVDNVAINKIKDDKLMSKDKLGLMNKINNEYNNETDNIKKNIFNGKDNFIVKEIKKLSRIISRIISKLFNDLCKFINYIIKVIIKLIKVIILLFKGVIYYV